MSLYLKDIADRSMQHVESSHEMTTRQKKEPPVVRAPPQQTLPKWGNGQNGRNPNRGGVQPGVFPNIGQSGGYANGGHPAAYGNGGQLGGYGNGSQPGGYQQGYPSQPGGLAYNRGVVPGGMAPTGGYRGASGYQGQPGGPPINRPQDSYRRNNGLPPLSGNIPPRNPSNRVPPQAPSHPRIPPAPFHLAGQKARPPQHPARDALNYGS